MTRAAMRSTSVLLVLVLASLISVNISDGARILGVFPMAARSHFFLGSRLMRALAARGHDVTMISPFPEKKPIPNYTDVPIQAIMSMVEGRDKVKDFNLFQLGEENPVKQAVITAMIGSQITELTLRDKNTQDLLKSDQKFDLVIVEMFQTEALFGLAHHYKCPLIVLSTIGSSIWVNHLAANPAPYSYIPDLFLQYSTQMTFCERLVNTVYGLTIELFRKLYYFGMQNRMLHQYFPDAPELNEIMYKNVSLVLLNSHPAISDPKPMAPGMVNIGGYHVEDPKPLPKDLKEFMDNAKDGVILFSMGSNLKSAELPVEKRDAILKAFSKLKQKVLWKWEDEKLPGKPANVRIQRWLPQNDLMAHPNLRAFVTHGGLLSTTEAIVHGVPVIGIPIFGDQKMNIATALRLGYGLAVSYDELTEEKLSNALNEILNNPSFRQNVKKRQAVLNDQPVKPIDNAIFWTEHVIRHKGADHLRSAALDLEWYELYNLDVIALLVILDIILLALFYIVIKKILGRKKHPKTDAKKKKN